MLWLKPPIRCMCMYIPCICVCPHINLFMLADTFVVEVQAVEMQIHENGEMMQGSSVYATLLQ